MDSIPLFLALGLGAATADSVSAIAAATPPQSLDHGSNLSWALGLVGFACSAMTVAISKQREWRVVGVWVLFTILTAVGWWIDAHGMSHGWRFITDNQQIISRGVMVLAVASAWSMTLWMSARFRRMGEEDAEWSRNYTKYVGLALSKCTVHFPQSTVSVEYAVTNHYAKSRRVWVAASVAVYGRDPQTPLFVLPVPLVSSDVAPGLAPTKLTAALPATLNAADAAQALAQYRLDGKLRADLVEANLTTLSNLTTSARTVTIKASAVTSNAEVFT